ncbi:MAG: Ryanodine receptor Ryr [Candidatus Hydrogenedentes bacterium]|nr:Ryanodine receptor Ryr [Candidatus Hydrogenedentota bacterium]
MEYQPQPIDTAAVNLPAALETLTEQLARHNHDVWAQGRMAEGWAYGPARDDSKKLHPCLVAYEELPDSEKDYDRRTALETLRAIVTLGYRIVPPPV